jgi:hypothetical protein
MDASPSDNLISELGERILAEFGADRTNNTLTRWLAHHVARLIAAADEARASDDPEADNRAAEARNAILQLWKHRSAWPIGWPPPRAAAIVCILDPLPDLDDSYWHRETLFSRLHTLHYSILATICDLATGGEDNIEQGWLDKFGELLTPDEVTLLVRASTVPQRLDRLLRRRLPTVKEIGIEQPVSQSDGPGQGAAGDPLIALADAYRETILNLLRDTSDEPGAAAGDTGRHQQNDR